MKTSRKAIGLFCLPIIFFAFAASAYAFDFPTAGWHRGDVESAQENSRKAVLNAFESPLPNIEVDITDFVNEIGQRIGLLSHDYDMERITGVKGKFIDHHDIAKLSKNSANHDYLRNRMYP